MRGAEASSAARLDHAAIGFRVKSGRAVTVLLAGGPAGPRVVDRRPLSLADAAVPDSIQPYHAGLDRPAAESARTVARLVKVVERFAHRAVAELVRSYRDLGHEIRGVGIVAGSLVDPATIGNDHIRAHAEEGRLFRTVVEQGVRLAGLEPHVRVEKLLLEEASAALGIETKQLRGRLTDLGREVGGPWRAEEKAAALAAWMALAAPRSSPAATRKQKKPGAPSRGRRDR